jgi:predicted nucleic acid-binding protein
LDFWIYALEGYPEFRQEIVQLFQAIDQGKLKAITSELSLAEALVKPMQLANETQQTIYKTAISSSRNVSVIPIEREILIKSAQIRSSTKLKLPDAIHVATAIQVQSETFLTNDQGFKSVSGIHTVLLSELRD